MINLSTQPTEIIKSMQSEIPSVTYQFKKPYGGTRKYLKYEDSLLDKALAEKQNQFTDINEYITPSGNRWISYTHIEYYPKALYAYAFHVSFIYYETYASCGAFFPTFNGKKKVDGVIVFTDHFFLRMAERTGKKYRSKELIREFISTKSTQACQADEDGDVIIKFKGGYGFGKEKSRSPRVIEVRTYLTEKMLSPSQRRKCEKIDAYAELVSDGMYLKDVALHTACNQELDAQMVKDKIKAADKLGLGRHMALASLVHMSFVRMLEDMLRLTVSQEQHAVIGQVTGECSFDFVRKYVGFDQRTATDAENQVFADDLTDVLAKCARKLKLRSMTKERITDYINNLWKQQK